MLWVSLIFIGYMTFVRIQLNKYLGLDIDWHILFHIIVLGLGILALLKTLMKGKLLLKKYELPFIIVIFLLIASGFFSLPNGFFMTYWGIFEYLYIFLWSYFLSFFYPTEKEIRLVCVSFKILVFIMVGIAMYQQLEYLLDKYMGFSSIIFRNHPPDAVRLGLLRPPSLVGTPTEWGSVALIYLVMEFYMKGFKLSFEILFLILSFILSVTRSLYLCMVVILFYLIIFRRKEVLSGIISKIERMRVVQNLHKTRALLMGVGLLTLSALFIIFFFSMDQKLEYFDFGAGGGSLRGYALYVAKSSEDKALGLGPGTFGSNVSVYMKSSHLQYNQGFFADIERLKTIDSFWIQSFIEMGALGLGLNLLLFFLFYKLMKEIFQNIDMRHKTVKSISFSCRFIPIIYAVNGIGFTTFIPSYVIWTSLLSGLVWGYIRQIPKEISV